MRLTLLSGAWVLLAGCSSGGLGKHAELSFAEVQVIQPGLSAGQIQEAFGPPVRVSRCQTGQITRMEYPALDAKQSRASVVLDFDGNEVLATKTFTGQILQP